MGQFASWRLGWLELCQEAELMSSPSPSGERLDIAKKGWAVRVGEESYFS